MRVIYNQSAALGVRTGVGHYTEQLFESLCRLSGAVQIEGYPRHGVLWARRLWSTCFPGLQRRRQTAKPGASSGAPGVKQRLLRRARSWGRAFIQRHSRGYFFDRRYDLYHEPNFIPFPTDLPTVISLHDLSVVLHPEWHPAERVSWFEANFRDTLARSRHFITGSHAVRQELIRHLGLAPERVTCAHYGVRTSMAPLPQTLVADMLQRLGLPPRYLLCVGTIEPRKNVERLMRAYCDLPAAVRERWPLLLVGCWGWNAEGIADFYHTQGRHKGVRHLGYVAERHLPVLYNGARALVFPSHYEGLGLPPLEMMACGGAVIASTAAAVREAVGNQADLVVPEDTAGWRDALARVACDDSWWQHLRDGAEDQARPFTWDNCAAVTLQVYHEVHQGATAPVARLPLAA